MNINNLSLSMQAENVSYNASLTTITASDKKLLEKTIAYLRPTTRNYEDSWGYIMQATRYGGMKWYDPQTSSLVFLARKSITDSTLVIPTFFAEPAYLSKALESIRKSLHTNQVIILKNINPDAVSDFYPYGFRGYTNDESWSTEARFDDQTYPQQLIDLKKLIQAKGKPYHNLRNALNHTPHITIRPYLSTDREMVLELFALKDMNSNKSSQEIQDMYYESHKMYPDADVDKFVITDNTTQEILGFIATSDITPHCTASVASIFKPKAQKARTWCTYQILSKKYHEGFQFVNLGGSEFEGSYNFRKWTFRPTEELKRTHLVYS